MRRTADITHEVSTDMNTPPEDIQCVLIHRVRKYDDVLVSRKTDTFSYYLIFRIRLEKGHIDFIPDYYKSVCIFAQGDMSGYDECIIHSQNLKLHQDLIKELYGNE